MSDINGGVSPNPNGSPIFPGTVFTGPLIAGNIIHSDGSGTLAAVGETNVGTANQGYVQMSQSQAGVTNAATTFTTTIVIPAQSQIIDIYMMTTTVGTGTFGVGTTAGGTTALTAARLAPRRHWVSKRLESPPAPPRRRCCGIMSATPMCKSL